MKSGLALKIEKDVYSKYENLFRIDSQIYELVKDIELLSYVIPVNIEAEKRKFFDSKYLEPPKFQYRSRPKDIFKLQQQLFAVDIASIEDTLSQEFYKEVLYAYSNLLQCLESIGQDRKFYFNSLKSYGTPTDNDVNNAHFILHFANEKEKEEHEPKYNIDFAVDYFKEFSKRYDFAYTIRKSKEMAASAMVENDTQTLVLKENHRFSENELKVLANHEIGVHLVTTFNGLAQPLKVFHSGFPNNVETQEGLALMGEYMNNCLTLTRLKELAYRVLASNSLRKGYSFIDTFDMLYAQFKVDREKAFTISLRVHRGGGFTKDYAYLVGFKNMYRRMMNKESFEPLSLGKVSDSYEDLIEHWKNLGIVNPPKYKSHSLKENLNRNKTHDFILENLK